MEALSAAGMSSMSLLVEGSDEGAGDREESNSKASSAFLLWPLCILSIKSSLIDFSGIRYLTLLKTRSSLSICCCRAVGSNKVFSLIISMSPSLRRPLPSTTIVFLGRRFLDFAHK